MAGTPVTFEILQNDAVIEIHPVTLDADGGYVLKTSLSGMVQVRAKAAHWLGRMQDVYLSEDSSGVNFMLTNGDVNGDNRINVLDYAILKSNYNKTGVVGNAADLNGDGNVNVLDYSILKKNYNVIGQ